ncbi:MAG: hypothetical protein FJW26_21740 [Acidimicrobiia bacterium]|nr:hypothetical protein [Acidimicrobiia bacterium]
MIILLLCCLTLWTDTASGNPITFRFTGVVTTGTEDSPPGGVAFLPGVPVGDPFSMEAVIHNTAVEELPGLYRQSIQFKFQFTDYQ